jgi:hypothetical protein
MQVWCITNLWTSHHKPSLTVGQICPIKLWQVGPWLPVICRWHWPWSKTLVFRCHTYLEQTVIIPGTINFINLRFDLRISPVSPILFRLTDADTIHGENTWRKIGRLRSNLWRRALQSGSTKSSASERGDAMASWDVASEMKLQTSFQLDLWWSTHISGISRNK